MSLRDQAKDDLDFIFDTGGFAVSAEWLPSSGVAITINGFLERNIESHDVGESEMRFPGARFLCKTVDADLLTEADQLEIGGVFYNISEKDINDYGVTLIYLIEK